MNAHEKARWIRTVGLDDKPNSRVTARADSAGGKAGRRKGNADKKTIVNRTFRTYVLENRYLKVTLLPEFGGPILSIIYKPTGHEQLLARK